MAELTRKKPAGKAGSNDFSCMGLVLDNSAIRANLSTSSAFCANVRVYLVMYVTGGNSSNRAFVDASAASNAVVSNSVSHFK